MECLLRNAVIPGLNQWIFSIFSLINDKDIMNKIDYAEQIPETYAVLLFLQNKNQVTLLRKFRSWLYFIFLRIFHG